VWGAIIRLLEKKQNFDYVNKVLPQDGILGVLVHTVVGMEVQHSL